MSDFASEESESSDFSESDTDLEDILEERIRPKNEHFFEETIPQFNRAEFMDHFRVNRDVANSLAVQFGESAYFKEKAGPYGKLTPLQQLFIFLWFAGHQTASYKDVSDRFNITISSLYRVLKRVTYFLSNLSPTIITWPNLEERQEIERFFREKNAFPGIIGMIDGTHIKIDKPTDDPESYINRKGYYSIQVQLVCDHKLKIRDMFAGYPGSVHDARVFRTSPLSQSLEEKCRDYHLLGDSAYPLLYNLLTPFPDRGQLSPQQINYNFKLSSNRIKIEHCNGLLKQKWRQLYHLKLKKDRFRVNFIRACCVLHNLAIDDEFNINLEEDYEEQDEAQHDMGGDGQHNVDPDANAVQKRNNIVMGLRR